MEGVTIEDLKGLWELKAGSLANNVFPHVLLVDANDPTRAYAFVLNVDGILSPEELRGRLAAHEVNRKDEAAEVRAEADARAGELDAVAAAIALEIAEVDKAVPPKDAPVDEPGEVIQP